MARDHREIGKQLDLFMFSPLSPGCPIWLPNGTKVYSLLRDQIRRLNETNGYQEVQTPILWKPALYETSGHLGHYAKNMFEIESEEDFEGGAMRSRYYLKPMNCPGHMTIFKAKQWSYRDLPLRLAEYGPLHRNEVSGAIGGLTRCRAFCQDDAHLFVTPETLQEEINKIILTVRRVYGWFEMEYRPVLSTRPETFMGDVAKWDVAEAALEDALGNTFKDFELARGEGAFYGPKIDFIIKDSLGREWQTATIQLDFQLPERFELEYTGPDDRPHRPIVIHRAVFGSFERFIGILLEHCDGNLPPWLAPIPVIVVPISDKVADYATDIYEEIKHRGVRCELDNSNGTLNHKILAAHNRQIPFLAIVGNKEKEQKTVSLRSHKGDQESMSLARFNSLMTGTNGLNI